MQSFLVARSVRPSPSNGATDLSKTANASSAFPAVHIRGLALRLISAGKKKDKEGDHLARLSQEPLAVHGDPKLTLMSAEPNHSGDTVLPPHTMGACWHSKRGGGREKTILAHNRTARARLHSSKTKGTGAPTGHLRGRGVEATHRGSEETFDIVKAVMGDGEPHPPPFTGAEYCMFSSRPIRQPCLHCFCFGHPSALQRRLVHLSPPAALFALPLLARVSMFKLEEDKDKACTNVAKAAE